MDTEPGLEQQAQLNPNLERDRKLLIDAKQKVKEVVMKGNRVLDTCSGLGYTAIWALRTGAQEIVSVECNESVIKLRKENPWSNELYNSKINEIS